MHRTPLQHHILYAQLGQITPDWTFSVWLSHRWIWNKTL